MFVGLNFCYQALKAYFHGIIFVVCPEHAIIVTHSPGLAVYSSVGKLGIELSNIGLGVGTCVAFYIIIGDLLPPLVAAALGLDWVSWFLYHLIIMY